MFGSAMLEVATGVIFIYLSLSLVCTAANELIASLLKWRAQNLANGIRNLLNYADDNQLMAGIYNHPLIQTLYKDKNKLPSYIPSRTFAISLLDTVAPIGSANRDSIDGIKAAVNTATVDDQVKKALLVLIDQADNSLKEAVIQGQKLETALSKVQENVEVWFNDSMERVGGWYKRKAQAWTFGLALVFTVALNVDTIGITKQLSTDSALRASLVAMAEKSAQNPPVVVSSAAAQPAGAQPATGQSVEAVSREKFEQLAKDTKVLEGLGIPLGWGDDKHLPKKPVDWILKVFGLLLTAGAASLGAPFWFDMLNKIISVRSSGKAPEEKQKSPKEVPTPTEAGQTPREAKESKDTLGDVKNTLSDLLAAVEGIKKPPVNT